MKRLTVVMELPEPHDLADLTKIGRSLGVQVIEARSAREWVLSNPYVPAFALARWRGPKTHDLAGFVFPERSALITGLDLLADPSPMEWLNGSIYVDQTLWDEWPLTPTAAGTLAMWEFHKQRGSLD